MITKMIGLVQYVFHMFLACLGHSKKACPVTPLLVLAAPTPAADPLDGRAHGDLTA